MPFCTCFLSMSNAISGVASASFYVQHTVHDEIAVETGSKLSGGCRNWGAVVEWSPKDDWKWI